MKNNNIRPLNEQFNTDKVNRIRAIQTVLFSSIYDDSVGKYYVKEINKALEAGLWLASLNLVNSYLEIVIRDLLFYSLAKESKINPFFGENASKLQQDLENSRNPLWSFDRIITELITLQAIDDSDNKSLKKYYKKVRIPIHHGLNQHFVRDDESEVLSEIGIEGILFGRVSWKELENKIENKGIDLLEEVSKLIKKFSKKIKLIMQEN